MQNKYSDIDLILYLYEELDPGKYLDIKESLKNDCQLKEEFQSVKKTFDILSDCQESPNPTTVELILEYSKSRSSLKAASQI